MTKKTIEQELLEDKKRLEDLLTNEKAKFEAKYNPYGCYYLGLDWNIEQQKYILDLTFDATKMRENFPEFYKRA